MSQVNKDQTVAVFDTPVNAGAIKDLESVFGQVVRFPEVRYRPVADPEDLAPLREPGQFDWVVVADVRAAEYLPELAESAGIDLFGLDETMVCAASEAAADQLRFVQVHADLIPATFHPESVTRAMAEYSAGPGGLKEKKVLVLGSGGSRFSPCDAIEKAGGVVKAVSVCETDPDPPAIDPRIKALILGGGIDSIYFGSAFDVFDYFRSVPSSEGAPSDSGPRALCGDLLTKNALSEVGIVAEMIQLRLG